MEPDFSIRKEAESIQRGDSSFEEILNDYKFPPASQPSPQHFAGNPSYGPSNDIYLGQVLAHLQGQPKSNFDGLDLKVNADVLRWILLLIFVIVLIYVLLEVRKAKARRNPLKRRLRKLEKRVKALSNRKALPLDDDV